MPYKHCFPWGCSYLFRIEITSFLAEHKFDKKHLKFYAPIVNS